MKRQINTQQVKEQDKHPPNQTKEEEIGNLLDKEFRIMIVKMIQDLENKMELQINSLETRVEKMQERGSDMTEQHHFHFSLSRTGEGNGNPLQCSCLGNPRDGGAWWAAISGVAQSRTRLK